MLEVITMFGVIMVTALFAGIHDIALIVIAFMIFSVGYQSTYAVTTQADYLAFVSDGLKLLYVFWLSQVMLTKYIFRGLTE